MVTTAAPCRIGDTYPMQHLDVQIRAYLYRWNPTRAADCGKPEVSDISSQGCS